MNINPITTLPEALSLSAKMRGAFIITGEHIGPTNLTVWKNAIAKTQRATYDLREYEVKHAMTTSVGFNPNYLYHLKAEQEQCVNELIALVGRVNGGIIRDVATIIKTVDKYATRTVDVYHGEALTLKQEMSELSTRIKEAEKTNGINPDYLKSLQDDYARKDARMKHLKTVPGMITHEPKLASDQTFRKEVEHEIGRMVSGLLMMPYEQVKALEAQAKAEKKAKRQAERQAQAKARDAKK